MSAVKLFVVFNRDNIFGKLTKFFTGCYAYHIGFAVPESNALYEMSFLFRRRKLSGRYSEDQIYFIDLPEGVNITEDDLKQEIFDGVEKLCSGKFSDNIYGYVDYLLFGFRKLYHLFGRNTPNLGGEICSEKVETILVKHGWKSPFTEVPSPCDFVEYFKIHE